MLLLKQYLRLTKKNRAPVHNKTPLKSVGRNTVTVQVSGPGHHLEINGLALISKLKITLKFPKNISRYTT